MSVFERVVRVIAWLVDVVGMATRHGEVLNRRECNIVDREYLLKFRRMGLRIVQPRTSTLEGIRVTFLFVAYGDLGRGEVLVFTPFGPTIEYTHERTCGALAYMPMHVVHMPIVRTFSFSLDAFWAQASIAIDTKQLKRDTSSVHGSGAWLIHCGNR